MRGLFFALVAGLLGVNARAAESTAVFDDVVVRQMWPWRTNVVVECSVRRVNGPSKAVLTLAVDGQSLGTVPATAFRTSCAFARGGKLHLEFDPKAVPALAARRRVDSLQVTLSSEAVDAEDVLYVIYDLQKRGQFAIVTTEELRAGLWGAWEEKIWSASGLVQTGKPVWTGVYYDGCEATHKNERNAIAWNSSNAEKVKHPVGQLEPNNYGLYDTLGNVWEWVLDWQAGAVDVAAEDPEGPTAAGASYWKGTVPKRMMRGAAYDCDYTTTTLHARTQNPVNESADQYGWRVALPAE